MVAVALVVFWSISPQKELGMNLGVKSHVMLAVFMGLVKLLSSEMFVILIDWVEKFQVTKATPGVWQPRPVAKPSLADPVCYSPGEEHTFPETLGKR